MGLFTLTGGVRAHRNPIACGIGFSPVRRSSIKSNKFGDGNENLFRQGV
jgi:hypothetical protein